MAETNVCLEHSGVCVAMKNHDAQIEKIPSLEEAVTKLTVLVDQLVKNQQSTKQTREYTFWNTKAGQAIPLCATLIIISTVMAIAGQRIASVLNYLPAK